MSGEAARSLPVAVGLIRVQRPPTTLSGALSPMSATGLEPTAQRRASRQWYTYARKALRWFREGGGNDDDRPLPVRCDTVRVRRRGAGDSPLPLRELSPPDFFARCHLRHRARFGVTHNPRTTERICLVIRCPSLFLRRLAD